MLEIPAQGFLCLITSSESDAKFESRSLHMSVVENEICPSLEDSKVILQFIVGIATNS